MQFTEEISYRQDGLRIIKVISPVWKSQHAVYMDDRECVPVDEYGRTRFDLYIQAKQGDAPCTT